MSKLHGSQFCRYHRLIVLPLLVFFILNGLSACAHSYRAPNYVVAYKGDWEDGLWVDRQYVSWVGPPVYTNAVWVNGHTNFAGGGVPGHYSYGY